MLSKSRRLLKPTLRTCFLCARRYVMHAMGVTPAVHRPESSCDGVYIWPREEHWRAPLKANHAKPWRYAKYVGHGGIGQK